MENNNMPCLFHADYVPSPHHLRPGSILKERYKVGRILGEGGFGITYLGFDQVLEMTVAIKEYFPLARCTRNNSAGNEVTVLYGLPGKFFAKGKQKYLYEARILAKMEKQPAVVDVRDYFEENNTAYIVMEYIEGITLEDYRTCGDDPQQIRCVSIEKMLDIFKPVLYALEVIHENGIIHRDICPANLILEKTLDVGMRLRLIDFGCAREAQTPEDTQTIILRHGFAPIEMYQQGGGQGPWTDIYEICATLYYSLTGLVPPMSTNRIVRDEIIPASKLCSRISPGLERALMKGLQVRPHRRFKNVRELCEILYAKD